MKTLFVILPTQLFESNAYLKQVDEIHLVEDPYYFQKTFHKQKLYLHIVSMHYYRNRLKSKYPKKKIVYITHNECNYSAYKSSKNQIEMFNPIDAKSISNWSSKNILFRESPYFLSTNNDLNDYKTMNSNQIKYNQSHFYKWQRTRLNILIDKDGKPEFNSWSFDNQNRNPFAKNYSEPIIKSYSSKYSKLAIDYIDKWFPNAFGNLDLIHFPTTHIQAKKHLKQFITTSLAIFGNTQDAISNQIIYGNHSNLSSSINIGLLTPSYVVNQVLAFYNNSKNKKNIIASVEGFIRQIIGWREYMRFIYHFHRIDIMDTQYIDLKQRLPNSWYTGTTELTIINGCVTKVQNYAYLHHIERLMVMNNLAMLYEISYKDIYKWFMQCFIDSYDWVMVPNVLMNYNSLSTSVTFMQKVYLASDNYLKKMSTSLQKNDALIINTLYWQFLKKYKRTLSKDYGLARQLKRLN